MTTPESDNPMPDDNPTPNDTNEPEAVPEPDKSARADHPGKAEESEKPKEPSKVEESHQTDEGADRQKPRVVLIGAAVLALLGVIAIGAVFAFGGKDSTEGSLSDGEIALVSDVPDDVGNITQAEYEKTFEQTWKNGGLNSAPKKGGSQYKQVKDAALGDLLDRAWLTGQAAEMDITVSDDEVSDELASIKKQQFKTDAAYREFLQSSGYSDEDVRDRVKLQVMSTKIQDRVTGSGKNQQKSMTKFIKEYNEKWTARTLCADDFLLDRCSNYEKESEDTAASDESDAEENSTASTDLTDTSSKPKIEASADPAPDKLETEDIVVGDGPEAKAGDTVSVQYVGALYDNGKEFDASWDRNQPFEFKLGAGQVIKGWDEGVEGMKVGGRRKLVIPPDLGYGAQGSPPTIPADSTLVFIVDLKSVN